MQLHKAAVAVIVAVLIAVAAYHVGYGAALADLGQMFDAFNAGDTDG